MSFPKITIFLPVLLLLTIVKITEGIKRPPFGRVGSALGDYRLANGEPFVTLYEHENYRGKLFRQRVRVECSNIPRHYWDWSSSVQLHGRCVSLCDAKNCGGNCKNLYPNEGKGVKRLQHMDINDKAKSLKFCYQQYG